LIFLVILATTSATFDISSLKSKFGGGGGGGGGFDLSALTSKFSSFGGGGGGSSGGEKTHYEFTTNVCN
jgi:hypothetical protein